VSNSEQSLIADSVFQPDSYWYSPQPDYPNYDPEKAKKLVQEYVAEKGPIEFTFGSTPDSDTLRPVQAIASQWQAVGIKANIRTTDQPSFIANAVTGNYDAQVWRMFGAPDPDGNYLLWVSYNAEGPVALNMGRIKDPDIDRAINDGRATIDYPKRKEAYDRLQRLHTERLPYLWLTHTRWAAGADKRLRGLQGAPLPEGGQTPGLVAGIVGVSTLWFDT
jgi:peptide/nickel transport system substrate-binding protein